LEKQPKKQTKFRNFVKKNENFACFLKIIAKIFGAYLFLPYLCIRFRLQTGRERRKRVL